MSGLFRSNSSLTPPKRTSMSPFCTSPGQLQDVTMDNSYTYGFRSPSFSFTQGVGTTSPGQGRSLKEYEEQMASLRKENFNLKLRIYFLEEQKPTGSTGQGTESLFKQNVDLKVEIEALRKELNEKQELLIQAAKALEFMEDVQKKTEEKGKITASELQKRIEYLEMEIKEIEKERGPFCSTAISATPHLGNSSAGGDDGNFGIIENETSLKISQLETAIYKTNVRNDELSVKLTELDVMDKEKSARIKILEENSKELQYQNSDLKEKLEEAEKYAENLETLKSQLFECRQQMAEKLCEIQDLERKLQDKIKSHNSACSAIQQLLHKTKKLQQDVDELKRSSNDSKTRKSSDEEEDDDKIAESETVGLYKNLLANKEVELEELQMDIRKITEMKNKEIDELRSENRKKTLNLQGLVNNELWEKNREIERLTKLLRKNKEVVPKTPMEQVNEVEHLQQPLIKPKNYDALERKKQLQKKVDLLKQKFCSNIESSEEVEKLKMALEAAKSEAEQAHKWRKECNDVVSLLTVRLEELAGFLDALLKHKDVLGALGIDRRRAMRKAIDRSLDLSRSLNNISLNLGASFNEQSLIQLSSISGFLEDSIDPQIDKNEANKENLSLNDQSSQTTPNKIIDALKLEVKTLRSELEKKSKLEKPEIIDVKKERKSLPVTMEVFSESEAWSEPDRNVSAARIGLEDVPKSANCKSHDGSSSSTTSNSGKGGGLVVNSTRSSSSGKKSTTMSIIVNQLEEKLYDRDNRLLDVQCLLVESEKNLTQERLKCSSIQKELEDYRRVNQLLEIEISAFKENMRKGNQLNSNLQQLEVELNDKIESVNKLMAERDKIAVDLRVAEMTMESMKSDAAYQKEKHNRDLEYIKSTETEKYQRMKSELEQKLQHELQTKEAEHQNSLIKNWVSKVIHEQKLDELKTMQRRLSDAQFTIDEFVEKETQLRAVILDHENKSKTFKKSLDDVTLQASKAALERSKATAEKLQCEEMVKEIQTKFDNLILERNELIQKIGELENENAILQKNLVKADNKLTGTVPKIIHTDINSQSGYTSEEVRLDNSSPDLGIESDAGRVSSIEVTKSQKALLKTLELSPSMNNLLNQNNSNDQDEINKLENDNQEVPLASSDQDTWQATQKNMIKLETENTELKIKLKRTRRALIETFEKLKLSNARKEQAERDIKQQILKTHHVLKHVRHNMESNRQLNKMDTSPPLSENPEFL